MSWSNYLINKEVWKYTQLLTAYVKKIIKEIIRLCLRGILGWNTYSLHSLKERSKKQEPIGLKEER